MSFTERRRSSSMTRTRSTKGFDFNNGFSEEEKGEEPALVRSVWGGSEGSYLNFASHVPSPRKPRRSSVDFADDLKICGFCRGEIGAGEDIFMYRGEVGFCSMECREEKIKIDERKEKFVLASKGKDDEYQVSVAKQNIVAGSDAPTPVAGTIAVLPSIVL